MELSLAAWNIGPGGELICSGEEGRRSLVLLEALYASARRGDEVYLAEILEGCDI